MKILLGNFSYYLEFTKIILAKNEVFRRFHNKEEYLYICKCLHEEMVPNATLNVALIEVLVVLLVDDSFNPTHAQVGEIRGNYSRIALQKIM